jgi:hypothetical protein
VPFEVDRAVRGFAVNFRPPVRATGTLMFSGNQIESPELRIGHDLFPQRPAAGRDNLNHCLHFEPSFSRKSVLLQCFFRKSAATANLQATNET